MRRITVVNHVTLDGVMQTRSWAGLWASRWPAAGALLLGRRTYEDFYAFWPKQTDNPYTEVLNNTQKYVASRTLEEPLPWSNSTLIDGDAAEAVARLKEQPGEDIGVL